MDTEKILVPDTGDLRKSTYKALPSPPVTAKRVMYKYRFSAIFPFAFAATSFALTIVLLMAGSRPGVLDRQFMISSSATASSSSNPLDVLNPLSTSNPLNPNNPNNPLSGLMGNLTDSINSGLGDIVNQLVEGDANIDKCSIYEDKESGLNAIIGKIQSSVVIGSTNISVPIIEELTHGVGSLTTGLAAARKATFAFLVTALIGSGLSALSALPAIFFPASRLLIFANSFWSTLAFTSHSLVALILSVLVVLMTKIIGGFGSALGLFIKRGNSALVFVWLAWTFSMLPFAYWLAIWFVDVRTWSFVKRQRTDREIGHWRGIGREIKGDLKVQLLSPIAPAALLVDEEAKSRYLTKNTNPLVNCGLRRNTTKN
ncbi:hypothetical protein P154DRAFT_540685 [Amniculicola lignicola CBS 123094]|uniref:Uncharacterized protein n=1 Tax=Amniculicola lignicola CBS 123094 TaxID=1392246 RepID=A0A6A5VWS4_9PLEO|nr:hypothetical protein P154DRAFT_540685 [Amniculicola lignicola CBS 123094]